MILTVTFEDSDNTYEIPMTKLLQIMHLPITVADVEAAVREALK